MSKVATSLLDDDDPLKQKNALRDDIYHEGEFPTLLILESTLNIIPASFNLMLKNLKAKQPIVTEFDLIFVVLYGIGLECGFYCDPDERHISERITQGNWHFSFNYDLVFNHLQILGDYIEMNGNVYKLNLNLVNSVPSITENDNNDSSRALVDDYSKYDFNLFCLKNGHSFLVTLVSNRNIKNSFSVYVPISKYLPFQVIENQKDYKIYYRNLAELSMKLKDQLFYPAKNFYFNEIGNPHPSLFGIPYELLSKIVRYLNHIDRRNLKLTCNRLNLRLTNEQ